jgi:predicted lipid-binding transport protein (Tim44 family)
MAEGKTMNSSLDLLTVLAAIAAVVILFRLRSVLGRKTGDEEARAKSFRQSPVGAADNVIPMNRPGSGDPVKPVDIDSDEDAEPAREKPRYAGPAAEGVAAITAADPSFDVPQFVFGARTAYEMIVTAFAEGNRKQLKQLLTREVLEGFQTAIAEREGRGETVAMQFVGIDRADLVDAEHSNKTARVTVKFVSQLIQAVKDKSGAVIDGDPKSVREVTDIWTFARDVSSRDPNWKLAATQTAN